MSRDDWLFDDGRRTAATERIYAAATELIYRDGMDAFSVDALAAADPLFESHHLPLRRRQERHSRSGARTGRHPHRRDRARQRRGARTGSDRVLTAIEVAVAEIRADPAGQLFLDSARGGGWNWLTASQAVADFASELTGLAGDDAPAAQWIVRFVMSLLLWPDADPHAEHQMLQRFVAPAFAESVGPQPY